MMINTQEPDFVSLSRQSREVKDKYNIVFILFLLIGIGTLVPWTFFSTGKSYFTYKFRNTSLPDDDYDDVNSLTPYQRLYENAMTMCSVIPNIISIVANLFLQKRIGMKTRFIGGSLNLVIVFIITMTFVFVDTDDFQKTFFILTMISVAILNASSAFIQGSTFGAAALFPSKITRACMEGQAVGGILASMASILSISVSSSPVYSAAAFFSVAILFIILSLLSFLLLFKMKFSRHYLVTNKEQEIAPNNNIQGNSYDFDDQDHQPLIVPTFPDEQSSIFTVIKAILPMAAGVCLVFAVTLSLFPSILAMITPMTPDKDSQWKNSYFIPVICFLMFNVSDYIGRFLGGLFRKPSEDYPKTILGLCCARLIFIPLFLLCNVQPRINDWLPVVFKSDVFPAIFVFLFGASNGYLSTICMIFGPGLAPTGSAERAGNAMSLFLTVGLGIGAGFSFLLVAIL